MRKYKKTTPYVPAYKAPLTNTSDDSLNKIDNVDTARLIRLMADDYMSQVEDMLLNFFGDYESADKYGKYFVLDTRMGPMEQIDGYYTTSVIDFLRPKTEDEMKHDGVFEDIPEFIKQVHASMTQLQGEAQ